MAMKKKAKKTKAPSVYVTVPFTAKTIKFEYKCVSGVCTVTKPKHRPVKNGDTAWLFATKTNATLEFYQGSPFASGHTKFALIADANPVTELIAGNSGTDYPYTLTCGSCGDATDDPSMIVD